MEQIILRTKLFIAGAFPLFYKYYNWVLSFSLIPQAFFKAIELNKYKKENCKVSLIVLCEHLGDIIACEPVSRYLKKQEGKKVIWVVNEKYQDILSLFDSVDKVVSVSCISEYIYMSYFLKSFETHNLHFDKKQCKRYGLYLRNNNTKFHIGNYVKHGSILETFSTVGGLPPIKESPHLLLKEDDRFSDIKKPYIVIQVESNEKSRTWKLEKWEELIANYPDYHFVEVGLHSHFGYLPNCDSTYCGKLTLIDIAYIINSSFVLIGIDSSLAHYANALGKNAIIMLGKYHNYDNYVPYAKYEDNFKIIKCEKEVGECPVSLVMKELDMLVKECKMY